MREKPRARSRLHRESGSLATLARIQAQSIGLRVEEVRTGSSSSAARFFDVEFGEADHVSTTLSAEERRERPLSSSRNEQQDKTKKEVGEEAALYPRNRDRRRREGTPPRCQILFIAPWLFVSR